MSQNTLIDALTRLFDEQRLVFWYDTQREFRTEFEALELPGVEKIELANNEFGVKYHVLREATEQKFLLYHDGPEPALIDNWLLDVQLASGRSFHTDQAAIWTAELGLAPNDRSLLAAHAEFFASSKRRGALHKLLQADDSAMAIQRKMLAVCVGSKTLRLDGVLEALLAELAAGENASMRLIERSELTEFFWQQMERVYGYRASEPTFWDFVLELFENSFMVEVKATHDLTLSAEALIFLRRWEDSRTHKKAFEMLSQRCADTLKVDDWLEGLDYSLLAEVDFFESIDRKILSGLVHDIVERQIKAEQVTQWLRDRRNSHWFDAFGHVYQALDHAARFLRRLDTAALDMNSLADGIDKYAGHWHVLDLHYRKFVYHSRASRQASLLNTLAEQVDNLYSHNYLARLNDAWQRHVDMATSWGVEGITLQRQFFARHVQPYRSNKAKVCVVISDAFRYEVGAELQSLIRREDKFEAELEPMLSMLPSYTQLGMAALLPNQELAWTGSDDASVTVDGQNATGSANRGKILAKAVPDSAVVLAKDVLAMGKADSRALVRDNDVVYVYHNLIDKTGDTRDTEQRVFDAAEDTLEELTGVIKKLFNANASHVLVTADHGFIYQHQPLDESDFLTDESTGDDIMCRNRRFVLGHGLHESSGFKKFTATQLGLVGDMEALIPKSIHRLRLKGSGSRFVHGGATLQEVVIPLLHVSKQRQSDVSHVEVDVIASGSKIITTGQLAVALYQREAVTEKRRPRQLRIGLYTQDGELISDQHELVFDVASDNAREREQKVRLLLSSKADEVNNQQVELRLEEPVEGASRFTTYKATHYTIRRSFTSEFDF